MRKFLIAAAILGALTVATTFVQPTIKSLFIGKPSKSASDIKWYDCDYSSTKYFKVSSVNFVGDFQRGTDSTVEISGTVVQDFTHVSTYITSDWGFNNKVFDAVVPLSSPQEFKVGPSTVRITTRVEKEMATGGYVTYLRVKDQNAKTLQCFLLSYNLA